MILSSKEGASRKSLPDLTREKNEQLDARVLEKITQGVRKTSIVASSLGVKDLREIDRSLQRLRKKGSIVFKGGPAATGGGWRLP